MPRPRFEAVVESLEPNRLHILDHRGHRVVNDNGEELVGAPLNPNSITQQTVGSIYYGTQLAAGIEQLLHPQIGAAVEHKSQFWNNPYRRVAVSLDPIMGVVYDLNPGATGARVRGFHRGIHGTDHQGRGFNALDPDAFYWAHKTFEYAAERTAAHYTTGPLSYEEKEQLDAESRTWYSRYGMPLNMVPASYHASQEYYQRMLDEVLEMNPSAERAINMAIDGNPPRPDMIPRHVWRLAKIAMIPTTDLVGLLTIGELSEDIRDKFNIPFSRFDQVRLDLFRAAARTSWKYLPEPMRYYPKAYESFMRERARSGETTATDHVYGLGSFAVKGSLNTFNKLSSRVPTPKRVFGTVRGLAAA